MWPGHRVRFLTDGHKAWQVLLHDLDAARATIDVQLYMLVADAVGEAFVEALVRASSRGVAVRLMIDGVGSMEILGHPLLDRLEAAGVQVHVFGPIRLSVPWRRWMRRNHRKVAVLDDAVAHVSGMNVSKHYYALERKDATWADAGVRLQGPVVAEVAAQLQQDWPGRRLRPLKRHEPFEDGSLVAVAFNRGLARNADANRRYLQAVRSARKSISIAQAYFLPERGLMRALVRAAKRGVEVRVLIPALSSSDVLVVSLATDFAVGRLLAAGVRVATVEARMLHAKLAIVDGHWWTVGSANLDPLSRQRNLEANAVGLGQAESRVLVRWFEEMWREARETTHDAWQHRPLWQKAMGALLWLFRPLL